MSLSIVARPWPRLLKWRDCLWVLLLITSLNFVVAPVGDDILYTPHLNDHLPPPPERVIPGPAVARISGQYYVKTKDWEKMKVRVTERLAYTLEDIDPLYFDMVDIETLVLWGDCDVLKPYERTIAVWDNRTCNMSNGSMNATMNASKVMNTTTTTTTTTITTVITMTTTTTTTITTVTTTTITTTSSHDHPTFGKYHDHDKHHHDHHLPQGTATTTTTTTTTPSPTTAIATVTTKTIITTTTTITTTTVTTTTTTTTTTKCIPGNNVTYITETILPPAELPVMFPRPRPEDWAPPTKNETWMPKWSTEDDFERLVTSLDFCVSEQNTSLLTFPTTLNNTYMVGARNPENTRLYTSKKRNIKWMLYIVGSVHVNWARMLNTKFELNNTVPLPERQPGVIDLTAEYTDVLNFSTVVEGLRGNRDAFGAFVLTPYIPVCAVPAREVEGCFRFEHIFYKHPNISEYKMKFYIDWKKMPFVSSASDISEPEKPGHFNLTTGPWASFKWLVEAKADELGAWRYKHFPQKDWRSPGDCRAGEPCTKIPMVPSARYMHSAVLYTTWNFEKHARPTICQGNPDCDESCVTDLTCLGGTDNYFGDNFFFRSDFFKEDDGEQEPLLDLDDKDCPTECCKYRRICMRNHDVLGYELPFDSEMMLVYAGRTYEHDKNPEDGKLIYHHCESIPQWRLSEIQEWRSCKEEIVDELWRYDISRGKWEFLKPDTSKSFTAGTSVGFPNKRYAHAAVMIDVPEEKDVDGVRRQFMYIYGGIGPQCSNGICNDMWKYEVPWAVQAYYPKFPKKEWNRGNKWYRLEDCPFGGRYRHSMAVTSDMNFIFVFGGQRIGTFLPNLLRYRTMTDMWEDMEPRGLLSITRLMYDYAGKMIFDDTVPLLDYDIEGKSHFHPDVRCNLIWKYEGRFEHCKICPSCGPKTGVKEDGANVPHERGDASIVVYGPKEDDRLALFGGFRTTWGVRTENNDSIGELDKFKLDPETVDPGAMMRQHYFDDLWVYNITINMWSPLPMKDLLPPSRRGHTMVTRRTASGDAQVVMFGGFQQDMPLNDMWILDIERNIDERMWTRIDQYFTGLQPPPMAYHSMVLSKSTNLIIVFGGLRWSQTNVEATDYLRNIDRRCFKEAKDIPVKYSDKKEEEFIEIMRNKCSKSGMCCSIDLSLSVMDGIPIRIDGQLDLKGVSEYCRTECERKEFAAPFSPILNEGVWTFSPDICPNNCSQHGFCDMGQCACDTPWYGSDCSQPRCPGSTCYMHPTSQEQYCIDCSQRGRCVNGKCECYPGWGYEDCSASLCEMNCSSTPTITRGICIEDFPTHQCHCVGRWSGERCEVSLCLNDCSGKGKCDNGLCVCDRNFYGEDCSVFIYSLDEPNDARGRMVTALSEAVKA